MFWAQLPLCTVPTYEGFPPKKVKMAITQNLFHLFSFCKRHTPAYSLHYSIPNTKHHLSEFLIYTTRRKMATISEKWSKSEIRAVIRFLHAKGNTPTKIHYELVSVYGKNVMSKKQVYQWYSMLQTGRSGLEHAQGSGSPQSALTDENIARVDRLIREDRRYRIQDLVNDLDLSKTTVHRIWYEELG